MKLQDTHNFAQASPDLASPKSSDMVDAKVRAHDPHYRDFESLFRALIETVIGRIRLMGFSENDAEDIAMEAFFNVYKALHRVEVRTSVRQMIFAAAMNVAFDLIDRRKREDRKIALLINGANNHLSNNAGYNPASTDQFDPHAEAVLHETQARLKHYLENLTEDERFVVEQRLFFETPFREIANKIGCSEATARSHNHRGLLKIRGIMSDS